MNDNQAKNMTLQELLDIMRDGTLSPSQQQELRHRIAENPQDRRAFVEHMYLIAALQHECAASAAECHQTTDLMVAEVESQAFNETIELQIAKQQQLNEESARMRLIAEQKLQNIDKPVPVVQTRYVPEKQETTSTKGMLLDFAGVQVYRTSRSRTRESWSWGRLAAALILVMVMPLGYLWFYGNPQQQGQFVVAQLKRTLNAQWKQPIKEGSDIRQNTWLDLTHGFAEIKLNSQSTVLLEAPCSFVIKTNGLYLNSGRLVAHVPQSGKGFTVETAKAKIVDFGTEFGVDTTKNGRTNVAVFVGEVVLGAIPDTSDEEAPIHRLLKGQASFVTQSGKLSDKINPVTDTQADRFVQNWGQAIYHLATTGDVQVLGVQPKTVMMDQFENNDALQVFSERRSVVLEQDLTVDLKHPGQYTYIKGNQATVAAGTRIDSYLLHYDRLGTSPRGDVPGEKRISGSITFQRPIVGVILDRGRLVQTDALLGSPTTQYGQAIYRGWINTSTERAVGDVMTISPDRLTLHFVILAANIDQCRVLIEAPGKEAGIK